MEIRQGPTFLPNHLRPHIGEKRPFRCELYRFYRSAGHEQRNVPAAFAHLLRTISAGQLKPFFDRAEIDQLMTSEVLSAHKFLNYQGKQTLDLHAWSDLLNAFSQGALGSRELIGSGLGGYDRDQLLNFQTGYRRMKIMEDWIYYHPEVQQAIRSMLAGTSGKGI